MKQDQSCIDSHQRAKIQNILIPWIWIFTITYLKLVVDKCKRHKKLKHNLAAQAECPLKKTNLYKHGQKASINRNYHVVQPAALPMCLYGPATMHPKAAYKSQGRALSKVRPPVLLHHVRNSGEQYIGPMDINEPSRMKQGLC